MSRGDGFEPDDDVVSFGADVSPRPVRWLLVGVAVAGLLVGYLAGARPEPDAAGGASADRAGSVVPVAAGAISNVAAAEDPTEFELPVFNPGDVEVEVTIVDLGGWDSLLQHSTPTTILPGTWRSLGFSARPDCHDPLPADVRDVGLRVSSPVRQYAGDVPLVDAGVLEDYHEAFCPGPVPLRRDELSGVWAVEKVYGRSEGVHLLRFNPDGTYAMDFDGGLLSPDPALYGTYRLRGASLTTVAEGGYGFFAGDPCDTTDRFQATLRSDRRLSLASVRGPCADGRVWIARRVLRDVGLPAAPGGRGPAPR